MPTTDTRVDAYIAKAPEFARPILTHIRATVHAACPDCEETIKWGAPAFMKNGIVLIMAAFKQHCAVNFWRGRLVVGEGETVEGVAGQLGRIESVKDLPPKKVFTAYIKKAAAINEAGEKAPKREAKPKPALAMPDEFQAAIDKTKKAKAGWEKLSPSHRREYIEWVTQAKGMDTRQRRMAQAVEWMSEGKSRNWKYM